MKLAGIVVAPLVAAVAAGAAPGARQPPYRNPTAGAALALQIPGMHRAAVRRNVAYRRLGGATLRLDVYRPRRARGALPAVLIGGPPSLRAGKDTGQKVGWSQAVAASGLAAVAFDTRSDGFLARPRDPSEDVAAAIRYVRASAARLGIDPDRLCALGFSLGTAPWHLWATMREPQPYVRCNVSYYGPLDFSDARLKEYSALEHLRRHGAQIPPMLVVKAGREHNDGINESIDRFVAEARRVGADVRLVTHATGGHAFDLTGSARSRAIVRETLAFFRARLLGGRSLAAARPPLRLHHRCVTAAERRRAVRFTAGDRTRLIGVVFGSGDRGVVLAHQGGGGAPGNLCAWVPYARSLAARGYRVLVFDHRGHGASDLPPRIRNLGRVDIDVVAAVRELRRRGVRTVVLGGASLGGTAVLGASARITPRVQGVMTFGAPATYRAVDGLAAVRRSDVPLLLTATEQDQDGFFAIDARRLYEAARAPDKRLAIFPGDEHGAPSLRRDDVRTVVDEWLESHSGSP